MGKLHPSLAYTNPGLGRGMAAHPGIHEPESADWAAHHNIYAYGERRPSVHGGPCGSDHGLRKRLHGAAPRAVTKLRSIQSKT